MTEVAHYACSLPRFDRSLVIAKGWDAPYALAISRNGRVLFLSERPLGELAGREVVVAVRPWYRRGPHGARQVCGTSVLVRLRGPVGRPVVAASAVISGSPPAEAVAVLPLSRSGALAFVPAYRLP